MRPDWLKFTLELPGEQVEITVPNIRPATTGDIGNIMVDSPGGAKPSTEYSYRRDFAKPYDASHTICNMTVDSSGKGFARYDR